MHRVEAAFVDTPEGIFTASGVWFRTREAWLHDYADAVFDREPLARLVAQAEVWLRSPQTIALWLLPVMLWVGPAVYASLVVLVVYVGWESLGPSFVSRTLVQVLRVLDLVMVQAVYYVVLLSVLAAQQQMAALGVGLGGFILLRWGLVRMATRPVVRRIWRTLYRLPVADHVLRAFIVRAALAHGVSIPEFDRIEREILKHLKRK